MNDYTQRQLKEFDNKFLNASAMPPTYEEIQAFLHEVLTDYKEEVMKRVVGMKKEITHPQFALYEKGYNKCREEMLELLNNI